MSAMVMVETETDERTARRLMLERKLAQLQHRADRYRRQADLVGPMVRPAFERRAAELELMAVALQARFGDACDLPLADPVLMSSGPAHIVV